MSKLNIITSTLGRDLYLKRLIESILRNCNNNFNFKHYIIFQNDSLNDGMKSFLSSLPQEYDLHIIDIKQSYSIGKILASIATELEYPITIKLDDDALIQSFDFINHIIELHNINPQSVFSPYPVGLINNPGGFAGGMFYKDHNLVYSENTNTYYTLRKSNHIGGFARVSPTEMYKHIRFTDTHSEDSEFSDYCNIHMIPMFYLENALIVEHQESTLGQHQRYGNDYFKNRF